MDSGKRPFLPPRLRAWLAPLVRILLLFSLVYVAREHHAFLRISGSDPVDIHEITPILPDAVGLRPDHSVREGLYVEDAGGVGIGYAVRTQPIAREITGYAGITDTLLVFDTSFVLKGMRIRSSEDTRVHVGDVKANRWFMEFFNGISWDDLGAMDLRDIGMEGVAGSTLTSMGIAEAIRLRVQEAESRAASAGVVHWRWRDTGVVLILMMALMISFSRLKGNRKVRRGFQAIVILYLGVHNGDLIAQSLLGGWARSSVPWTLAPGLVLLVAAAFLVPMATRRPFYCHQLCPHGAAQEWLTAWVPARWKWNPEERWNRPLKWIAPSLLLGVVIVVMLNIPFDLAGIEPFDAYLLKAGMSATVWIALLGLCFSAIVPMGYCRYGCPTGALLKFVRSRGVNDSLGTKEVVAFLLILIAFAIARNHEYLSITFME